MSNFLETNEYSFLHNKNHHEVAKQLAGQGDFEAYQKLHDLAQYDGWSLKSHNLTGKFSILRNSTLLNRIPQSSHAGNQNPWVSVESVSDFGYSAHYLQPLFTENFRDAFLNIQQNPFIFVRAIDHQAKRILDGLRVIVPVYMNDPLSNSAKLLSFTPPITVDLEAVAPPLPQLTAVS